MKNFDERLLAAASFARSGKRFADIGTDHSYLPIWLCDNNISLGGVASDINDGPVKRARINVSEAGYNEVISVIKTDGLVGIENYHPDDIFILGMGGELISSILDNCRFIRNKDIRLILQPMTHAEDLRLWLDKNGFNTVDEIIIRDGRRFYQIICAEYDGLEHTSSEIEAMLGKINIKKSGETLKAYAEYLSGVFNSKAIGMQKAGLDSSHETETAVKLQKISQGQSMSDM